MALYNIWVIDFRTISDHCLICAVIVFLLGRQSYAITYRKMFSIDMALFKNGLTLITSNEAFHLSFVNDKAFLFHHHVVKYLTCMLLFGEKFQQAKRPVEET